MKTAVVIGSTGLVGAILIKKLVQEGFYSQIIAIGRQKPKDDPVFGHPKVRFQKFDFLTWDDLELQIKSFTGTSSATFFSCLGTTIGKAQSEEAFKKVDHEYVVAFARLAKMCRAERLLVVSALGADKNSGVFYNKVKGEMEEAVEKEFSQELHFLRPSLLLGDRRDFRLGERLAILLAPVYAPLLLGSFKKYRPVSAERVAHTLVGIALKKIQAGKFIENSQILHV